MEQTMTEVPPDSTRRIIVQPAELLVPSSERAPEISIAGSNGHRDTSEARKLGTLLDVSQALAGQLNLQAGLSGAGHSGVDAAPRCEGCSAPGRAHGRSSHPAGLGLAREGSLSATTWAKGSPARWPHRRVYSVPISQPRGSSPSASRRERRGGELSSCAYPSSSTAGRLVHCRSRFRTGPTRLRTAVEVPPVVASMISQAVRIHGFWKRSARGWSPKTPSSARSCCNAMTLQHGGRERTNAPTVREEMREWRDQHDGPHPGESGPARSIAQAIITLAAGQEAVDQGELRRIARTLVESELFGHEKGPSRRAGRKRAASSWRMAERSSSTRSAS